MIKNHLIILLLYFLTVRCLRYHVLLNGKHNSALADNESSTVINLKDNSKSVIELIFDDQIAIGSITLEGNFKTEFTIFNLEVFWHNESFSTYTTIERISEYSDNIVIVFQRRFLPNLQINQNIGFATKCKITINTEINVQIKMILVIIILILILSRCRYI